MECIVHFEVKNRQEIKRLRGLLFIEKGKKPSAEQLIEMFKDMHYEVALTEPDRLLFTPTKANEEYEYIRVTELDTGEEKYTEDRDLKNIISTLMPQRPPGL
ncbi:MULTISPECIES: hypothetical protein [Paenibacillus]|jgi:hypothetical protein|uniref:Uncharacterized protein n=1 Tax=Paenibacillus azoreducens TaxID=116718 RepID=A0A919YK20_9BACL|nr:MULTISPECIES: hypothetical protein [Paenibacillus]MBE9917360.1 hypothetical protein [Paenibacillus donghaensis]GIO50100.1 hypothetical protein J34TS1_48650 [Paenibacillus azoreducens]